MTIVENVVCGPCALKDTEVDLCLGISREQFGRSTQRRNMLTEARKGSKWENADLEGKHREWGEPIGGLGHLGDHQGYHKEQTTGNRKHDKIKRENTFIFEKNALKCRTNLI